MLPRLHQKGEKMSDQADVQIDEKIKKQVSQPKKYNVIFMNDDLTPMDWVISVLKEIYKHSQETAEYLTLTIHNDGAAVVGTYSYEIAEQKSLDTVNISRSNGFPLQVKLEQES